MLGKDGHAWVECKDRVQKGNTKRELNKQDGCEIHEIMKHVVDEQKCVSARKARHTLCSGNCPSQISLNPDGTSKKDCKMCSGEGLEKEQLVFICQDGTEITKDHYYFKSCKCDKCS
jgi:hypothetical protein